MKANAVEIYLKTAPGERDWGRKHRGAFSIFFSSSTDPWQPQEKKSRVTRRLLAAMQELPPDRLILQTHSAAILDDEESICELSRCCELRVHISIEGDRERLPGMPPPPSSIEDRILALQGFANRGLTSVACLSPLYPLENPDGFFRRLAEAGVRGVILDHFIQGDGTPDGTRTLKTSLPEAMRKVNPAALQLSYRDSMAEIAKKYLPVGLSSDGFAGRWQEGRDV
ncbi:MAG: hypothetical protein G3M78_13975 [Candidatus Nitrohelix vancouverensis]|uniref:Amidohydrolase-related domain-containing protein n=1 Tax=Candidatus Nitrohelix vancouverensis TaxID=2705534 RepID=A0A7T0C5J1_9BACT|nr:MAG: hypothetical protein G3M78_13975 [Candidatus Nitrohelix vancouverensis]